jgi:hypothetical protein
VLLAGGWCDMSGSSQQVPAPYRKGASYHHLQGRSHSLAARSLLLTQSFILLLAYQNYQSTSDVGMRANCTRGLFPPPSLPPGVRSAGLNTQKAERGIFSTPSAKSGPYRLPHPTTQFGVRLRQIRPIPPTPPNYPIWSPASPNRFVLPGPYTTRVDRSRQTAVEALHAAMPVSSSELECIQLALAPN